jgi:protein-S-isoprenylcysteine O-methyltransferase Ste14
MIHPATYALARLSPAVAVGSLIAFTVFLYVGSFPMVELPLGVTGGLVLDAGLCLGFFLQHSGMIRIHTRKEHFLGRRFKAVFSIASGMFLLGFIVLWQESPVLIASADGLFCDLTRIVFFIGVAGQIWTTVSLTVIDPFGVEALTAPPDSPTDAAPQAGAITTKGAYGWVRHPGYFSTLLLIWGYPDLTADRLLLDVLFTLWIILGAFLEERDLVAIFGEDYRSYQRTVPMLIPYRKPRRAKIQPRDPKAFSNQP